MRRGHAAVAPAVDGDGACSVISVTMLLFALGGVGTFLLQHLSTEPDAHAHSPAAASLGDRPSPAAAVMGSKGAMCGAPDPGAAGPVFVPPKDKRKYAYLHLPNGLRALTVSDPDADTAAAAVDVGVGSLYDPPSAPGLAHFLEHMLFTGNEKYPKEGEYFQFVSTRGGVANAATGLEHTTFHFELPAAHLAAGLDRLLAFFAAPSLDPGMAAREMNAVSSEHAKNIARDEWRFQRLRRITTGNPKCPLGNFMTGNLETLRNATASELRAFYNREYAPSRMTLAVVGREGPADLERMVRTLAGAIPARPPPPPKVFGERPGPAAPEKAAPGLTETASGRAVGGRRVDFVPVADMDVVRLVWYLPPFLCQYETKSLSYLTRLLGDEGPGSLAARLRGDLGWAEAVSAGAAHEASFFSSVEVSIALTAEGRGRVDEIVAIVFAYLDLIRATGGERWRWEEAGRLADMAWKFQPPPPAAPLARSLAGASNQHGCPICDALRAPFVYRRFDAREIGEIAESLTYGTMLLYVGSRQFAEEAGPPRAIGRGPRGFPHAGKAAGRAVGSRRLAETAQGSASATGGGVVDGGAPSQPAPTVGAHVDAVSTAWPRRWPGPAPAGTPQPGPSPAPGEWQQEEYYGVQYRVTGFTPAQVALWRAANQSAHANGLALPERNPYIPGDFSLLAAPEGQRKRDLAAPTPALLRDGPRGRLWHHVDSIFAQPRASVICNVYAEGVSRDPRSLWATQLLVSLVADSLRERAYPATLAGLGASVGVGIEGLEVSADGYSDKLLDVLDLALSTLATDPADLAPRFAAVKESLVKDLKDARYDGSLQTALTQVKVVVRASTDFYDRLAAVPLVEALSLEDLRAHKLKLFDAGAGAECLVNGNLAEADATRAWAMVQRHLGDKPPGPTALGHIWQRVIALPLGDTVFTMEALDSRELNSAVLLYYEVGSSAASLQSQACLELLCLMVQQPVFDQVRTKEQLGYTVGLKPYRAWSAQAVVLYAQSDAAAADYLDERFEAFLRGFAAELRATPAADFARAKGALADTLRARDTSLDAQTERMWAEVEMHDCRFNRSEALLDHLSDLELDDVVQLYDDIFLRNETRRKLSIWIRAPGEDARPAPHREQGYNPVAGKEVVTPEGLDAWRAVRDLLPPPTTCGAFSAKATAPEATEKAVGAGRRLP